MSVAVSTSENAFKPLASAEVTLDSAICGAYSSEDFLFAPQETTETTKSVNSDNDNRSFL